MTHLSVAFGRGKVEEEEKREGRFVLFQKSFAAKKGREN